MNTFSKISASFWTGDLAADLREIDDEGEKLAVYAVAFYLMTNPACNSIGLYPMSIGRASDDLGMSIDKASDAFEVLEKLGLIRYDKRMRFVWIVKHAKHRFRGDKGPYKAGDKKLAVSRSDLAKCVKSCLHADFVAMYTDILHLNQEHRKSIGRASDDLGMSTAPEDRRQKTEDRVRKEEPPKTTVGERASGIEAAKRHGGGAVSDETSSDGLSEKARFVVVLSKHSEELFGRIPSPTETRALGKLYDGMVEAWKQSASKMTGFAIHRLNEGHADNLAKSKSVSLAYYLPNLRTRKPNQILRAYQEAASNRASAERFWRNPAPPDIWPEAIHEESFENWRASAVEYAEKAADGLAEDALDRARPIAGGKVYVPHYLDLERIQRATEGSERFDWTTHHGEELMDCKKAKRFAAELEKEQEKKNVD